jgi:hypothetical protein
MSFRDLGKLKHKLGPGAGVQLESLAALPGLSRPQIVRLAPISLSLPT